MSTDIIGYPIFNDFNPRRYAVQYLLVAVAFPALAIGVWSLLELLAGRRAGRRRELLPSITPEDESDRSPARREVPVLAYLRLAVVGVLIATSVAVTVEAPAAWPLTLGVPVALAYVGLARAAAGVLASRQGLAPVAALPAVNAVCASFAFLALAVASEAIKVEVDSVAHAYDLAPLWALLAIGLAVAAVVSRLVWRARPEEWPRIERGALLLVVAPVLLFLAIAFVPGELSPPDFFHEGERLGASTLAFDRGEFPWRDFFFVHGFLSDIALPGLSTASVEDSRWGYDAGIHLLEDPLLWISVLLLCVYLFRRNWVFLVASQLLLVCGSLEQLENVRLMLAPLSLLALGALLGRSTWPRALLLMALTVAQVIMVPEATPLSVAAWAVVVPYEIVHRRTPAAQPWRSSRTLRIAVSGAALTAAFAIFLVANDALDGFVAYYRTFVGNHDLTGGFEIQWADARFFFWAVIPIVVILVAWAYAAARVWTRRWFTTPDWVVGAAVLGLLAYEGKFLARPDAGHMFQVAFVALVPALYILYRLIQYLDGRAQRSNLRLLSYRPASIALLLAVLVLAPTSIVTVISELPGRFTAVATADPRNARLGFLVPDGDNSLPGRVQQVIDTYAPTGKIFDFTNSPLLFDFLIDADSATRFSHVSMAIRAKTQEDLIAELEDEKPELVAYGAQFHGLPNWDAISNTVRHYLVSDYLLDHYHPVAKIEDYTFMARNGVAGSEPEVPDANDLYFEGLPCDWGYVPAFLNQGPDNVTNAVDVPAESRDSSVVINAGGWAADVDGGEPARRVLVVVGDRIIAELPVAVPRADVVDVFGAESIRESGFQVTDLAIAGGTAVTDELRFFGVDGDGVASELGQPVTPPPAVLRHPDGSEIEVVAGALLGSVDNVEAIRAERYELDLPAGFQPYDWLRVTGDDALGESRFILSDERLAASRAISFSSLGRLSRDTEQVRVGACPQWKGYGRGPVFLDVTGDAGPLAVRLIR